MEIILRLNKAIHMRFPWKPFGRGMILALFCTGLYMEVRNVSAACEVYEVREIENAILAKEVVNLHEICNKISIEAGKKMDLSVAGIVEKMLNEGAINEDTIQKVNLEKTTVFEEDEKLMPLSKGEVDSVVESSEKMDTVEEMVPAVAEIKVIIHGNGGMPEVVEVTCTADTFDINNYEIPSKPGKIFDGWYLDSECTIPFTGVTDGCEVLELYANWANIPGLITSEEGYITGYTDPSAIVKKGMAVFSKEKSYTGITSGVFKGLETEVFEVYISENIRYIEPGVFDALPYLMYIEVNADNPVYYSDGGMLYHNSGELLAIPAGW